MRAPFNIPNPNKFNLFAATFQQYPSYMAVMLNMTDSADILAFYQKLSFRFRLYNQVVALAVFAGFSGT
jgi:hypothetical protein